MRSVRQLVTTSICAPVPASSLFDRLSRGLIAGAIISDRDCAAKTYHYMNESVVTGMFVLPRPFGSWLCENAKTLNRDRRSYSSKTALGLHSKAHQLEIELKNVILVAFRLFRFYTAKVNSEV